MGLGSLLEVFFKVSRLKRKSEVLRSNKKESLINSLFEMCQYTVPAVRSGEKGGPILPTGARLFHYTAQNNSRPPLKRNDALFFETICGKFGNNDDLFLEMPFLVLPGP